MPGLDPGIQASAFFARPARKHVDGRDNSALAYVVMPGLDPGIHVLFLRGENNSWMAGSSPAMTRGGVAPATLRARESLCCARDPSGPRVFMLRAGPFGPASLYGARGTLRARATPHHGAVDGAGRAGQHRGMKKDAPRSTAFAPAGRSPVERPPAALRARVDEALVHGATVTQFAACIRAQGKSRSRSAAARPGGAVPGGIPRHRRRRPAGIPLVPRESHSIPLNPTSSQPNPTYPARIPLRPALSRLIPLRPAQSHLVPVNPGESHPAPSPAGRRHRPRRPRSTIRRDGTAAARKETPTSP